MTYGSSCLPFILTPLNLMSKLAIQGTSFTFLVGIHVWLYTNGYNYRSTVVEDEYSCSIKRIP